MKRIKLLSAVNDRRQQLRPNWRRGGLVVVLGLGLLGYGLSGVWAQYQATHRPKPLPAAKTMVTNNQAPPDETPVEAPADYQVPPNQPRQINLPSIATQGLIQKVGLDRQTAMATPTNVGLAGWYSLGPQPGDPGVSVINGHVQGKYRPGIFKKLNQLKPGDQFGVEFGDHSWRQFTVVSVKLYTPADLSAQMFKPATGMDHQLNLITCAGRFNKLSQQYDQRILVVSRPAG